MGCGCGSNDRLPCPKEHGDAGAVHEVDTGEIEDESVRASFDRSGHRGANRAHRQTSISPTTRTTAVPSASKDTSVGVVVVYESIGLLDRHVIAWRRMLAPDDLGQQRLE